MQLVLLCVLVLSLLQPGLLQDGGTENTPTNEDLFQCILELKNIVLDHSKLLVDFSHEVRGQLATFNDTMNILQGQLESLAGEVTRNRQRINEVRSLVESEQTVSRNISSSLAATSDQLSTEHQALEHRLTEQIQTVSCSSDCDNGTTKILEGQETVLRTLYGIEEKLGYKYTCGGSPGWRRVAFLNMTDPSQDCPSGWNLTTHSVRTCGRVSSERLTCDAVIFPVSGGEYSRVCGRIKAYQYGLSRAFFGGWIYYNRSLDGPYVDGYSITHGQPRKHIWTFANGLAEEQYFFYTYLYCYCDVHAHPLGHLAIPPAYVSNEYFCESGVSGRWSDKALFSENPLWDGQNCGQNSTCCSMNNPPYFTKDLPAPTTDDIEVRLCNSKYSSSSDHPIELLEIYVQ